MRPPASSATTPSRAVPEYRFIPTSRATYAVAGRVVISVAEPCCTMRPCSSTTIRVASSSASIGSCVISRVGPR